MSSFLRQRTEEGARTRYSGRNGIPAYESARSQLERELTLIEKLKLEGYFLIVWDIVQFCKQQGILIQGRGSAANSAVCFALGITAVDPIGMELLFERFLSAERGEWPDIDLDLPSGEQRERAADQDQSVRYGHKFEVVDPPWVGPAEPGEEPGADPFKPGDRDVPAVHRQQREQVEDADEEVQ